MPDKINSKASEELYQTTLMQTYLCLKKDIVKADVSTRIGTIEHDVKFSSSHFEFAGGLWLFVTLGVGDTCFTMNIADCEEEYGVHVTAWFNE
jgi:hypothetical protein